MNILLELIRTQTASYNSANPTIADHAGDGQTVIFPNLLSSLHHKLRLSLHQSNNPQFHGQKWLFIASKNVLQLKDMCSVNVLNEIWARCPLSQL